jgi:hypothetical protein
MRVKFFLQPLDKLRKASYLCLEIVTLRVGTRGVVIMANTSPRKEAKIEVRYLSSLANQNLRKVSVP